jgi:GGDEF domain-containing protein
MLPGIKKYKELEYLAFHDPLTSLLNRTWLYKNHKKIKHHFVFFIDINDLHKVNERGHTAGDEYIKLIINSIVLFNDDVLIRYAGDEFLLFSNNIKARESNKYFTVGFSPIYDSVVRSIQVADKDMLYNKKNHKAQLTIF